MYKQLLETAGGIIDMSVWNFVHYTRQPAGGSAATSIPVCIGVGKGNCLGRRCWPPSIGLIWKLDES